MIRKLFFYLITLVLKYEKICFDVIQVYLIQMGNKLFK